jgi:hypothetical protein
MAVGPILTDRSLESLLNCWTHALNIRIYVHSMIYKSRRNITAAPLHTGHFIYPSQWFLNLLPIQEAAVYYIKYCNVTRV